jgi:ribosomal protein S18 acetylase RimI-like enzyme
VDVTIEPLLGGDLLAFAQCAAIDASVFPYPSIPWIVPGAAPSVWLARERWNDERPRVLGFAATRAQPSLLEIIGLAVESHWRGGGIGRALVRAVVGAAPSRGARRLALHVSIANYVAVALYESEGFERASRIRSFYSARSFPAGGDAWLMVRDVSVPIRSEEAR